jgi:Tfp pilus assembly protein PilO
MKQETKKTTNAVIVAMLIVAAVATAFWIVALSPKRDEAAKLEGKIETLKGSLAQHQAEAATALEARRVFPQEYQRLVVLGKAVPGDDDTASLLVQVNRLADRDHVRFQNLELTPGNGSEGETASVAAPAGTEPISPTEASAALLPLGATIGPAGLGVMPYTLKFEGTFFQIADFIKGLDALVKTHNEDVAVDGRLITVDGFSLQPSQDAGFPVLEATFAVTTFLTPPSQGLTAGASPTGPESSATLTSSTTEVAP